MSSQPIEIVVTDLDGTLWAHEGQLAAATRVWRDFFANPEEVYTEGYSYIRDCWQAA